MNLRRIRSTRSAGGPPRPLLDAGGARMRAEQLERQMVQEARQHEAVQERVRKAAGRIPVLKSIDEVRLHAMESVDPFNRSYRLLFPALQITRKLDLYEVFAALPQNEGRKPNRVAERTNQPAVGPHFDNYSQGYSPWTVHENLRGNGIIKAAFLSRRLYAGYLAMAEALPATEGVDELLASNRAMIGALALQDRGHQVYKGDMTDGTRTLIWHGDHNTTPAAHDIMRTGNGDYRIYAYQYRGTLGAGFTEI